jgi:D-xylose 1-dehydrogenase (NADP+, D-xylono-1,5-lactone-forming)
MAKILNWGMICTANINQAVMPPLKRSQRNRLLGVASRDLGRAEAYAKEWSIPRAYGSYEALLADPEIDVVYISLPNSLHAEWTIRAAQAGKHVMCEKPLAITLEQVDAVTAAARQNNVVVAEAFMYRHHPQTLKVKELVAGGALGQPWLVRGSFSFRLSHSEDVRLSPDLLGGSLWDVGCYPVSYARTMLGEEPTEVYGWQVRGPSRVDLFFAGTLTWASGAVAQIDCGFRPSDRAYIEIVGEGGSLTVPNPFKPFDPEQLILKRGDVEESIPVPAFDLYAGEIEDMADAILEGKPPRISLADSRANVAALLALYESAQTGKPVRL